MITIEVHDQDVLAAFNRLLAAAVDPGPALHLIGERLSETTKRRFAASTAPDGSPWAPNSPVTLARYLAKKSGAISKRTGGYTKKGAAIAAGKKPLIGETRRLAGEIHYNVEGNAVTIGSVMKYAAVQQFGAVQGALGRNSRGGPIPWGNIPARPFLGVSAADKADILDILRDHLLGR